MLAAFGREQAQRDDGEAEDDELVPDARHRHRERHRPAAEAPGPQHRERHGHSGGEAARGDVCRCRRCLRDDERLSESEARQGRLPGWGVRCEVHEHNGEQREDLRPRERLDDLPDVAIVGDARQDEDERPRDDGDCECSADELPLARTEGRGLRRDLGRRRVGLRGDVSRRGIVGHRRGQYDHAMELSTRTVTLDLAETFVIARESQDTVDLVEVEIRHDGVSGYGEAAPIDRYAETVESATDWLAEAAQLLGDDPWALDEIHARLPAGQQAARGALDAALHDLCGKRAGVPLYRMLGLRPEGPPTSWTVWLGDPDDMARRADAVAGRFLRLKLKLGGRDGLDVERVRAVRSVTDVPLQVDVNEYWSLEEAQEALPPLAELGVEYCEQPLPAGDPGGPNLKAFSPIPIYVDEDCHTLADVAECAGRAHGINIKLAKSGGVREAVRMAAAARALGLGVMLGCMVESGLGIAAAAQIASLCDHVDLDGNLLLAHDPWPGVAFLDGIQVPADEPGLGVREEVPDPR